MNLAKKRPAKPSIYAQTCGNPYLRSIAIEALLGDLDRIEAQGKKDSGYWRFVVNQLHSLGAGDYDERDAGNDALPIDESRYN